MHSCSQLWSQAANLQSDDGGILDPLLHSVFIQSVVVLARAEDHSGHSKEVIVFISQFNLIILSHQRWTLESLVSWSYSCGSEWGSCSTGWNVVPAAISCRVDTAACCHDNQGHVMIIICTNTKLTGNLKRIFGDCTMRGFLKLRTTWRGINQWNKAHVSIPNHPHRTHWAHWFDLDVRL